MLKKMIQTALLASLCSFSGTVAKGASWAAPYGRLLTNSKEMTIVVSAESDSLWNGRLIDQSRFSIETTSNNSAMTNISLNGITRNSRLQTDKLTAGKTHTIVVVASASTRRCEVRIDGETVFNDRNGQVLNGSPVWREFCIGSDSNGNRQFSGKIHKVALWNRPLSQEELASLNLSTADYAWNLDDNTLIAGNLPLRQIRNVQVDGSETKPPQEPLSAWYKRVPNQWTDMLPIGNGFMGGMVAGKIEREMIILNEDTVWTGGPYDHLNKNASADHLKDLRNAIFSGNNGAANQIADRFFLSNPRSEMAFSVAGVLSIDQDTGDGQVTQYRHALNLRDSLVTTDFVRDGVPYHREYFASYPDHVIVSKLTSSEKGKVNVSVSLGSAQDEIDVKTQERDVILTGKGVDKNGIQGSIRFQIRARVFNVGGKLEAMPKNSKGVSRGISVKNADEAYIVLTIATNYNNFSDVSADPEQRVSKVMEKIKTLAQCQGLKDRHTKDYQNLFNRVSLNLGDDSQTSKLPTNERLAQRRQRGSQLDPTLAVLYFQFGRYLLISSSRAGSQPANLQGVWSEELNAPWEGKYTININTEMNYWLAENANLSECHTPLFDMIESMVTNGRKTAKQLYQIENGGWVAHHNTDLWRQCGPIDLVPTGLWPMGAAWLSLHFWNHYEFTRNLDDLKKHYPVMRDAARFFLDFLIPDEKHGGVLVTSPSYSPEQGPLCASPTMDTGILMALFKAVISSSEILNTDAELREQFKKTLAKLPPFKIGSWGQLQEWQDELREDNPNNQHRHISHLFAVFPGNVINASDTKLFEAAKNSLTRRGDDATGWSMGWKINLWARMKDGDHTWKMISNLIHPSRTYDNLFDAHPPFQIDGNFGGAAGIVEMLLQSHEVTADGKQIVELLPALPSALQNGSVQGLVARTGCEVAMQWNNGMLQKVTISQLTGLPLVIRYGTKSIDLTGKKGSVTLSGELK